MPGPRALQPAGLPTYLERTCPCSVAITELVLPGNGTDSPYGRKQMWRVTQSYEWVYPKREQLVYSYFPAFLHQWVSAVFRGTVCCLGSTNRNPRALGWQIDEGVTMARHLHLGGFAWTEPCPHSPRQHWSWTQEVWARPWRLGNPSSQKLKPVTQAKTSLSEGDINLLKTNKQNKTLEALRRPANHKDLVKLSRSKLAALNSRSTVQNLSAFWY